MALRGTGQRPALQWSAVALAVASCFASGGALANPTGAQVKSGNVTFQQSGNVLQITNSPNAVIHWQGFSIGQGEVTRFVQQSAASAVLNRVVGANPSAILGTLQSNGRVFLINPNGIVFGAGSTVDVAGLVASTLNLTDADFIAGRLRFGAQLGAGNIVNEGAISTPAGGQVYLIAPNVQNSGVITTPKGGVVIAAGRTVEMADALTPLLRVEVTAPDNEAVNAGKLIADGGRVSVYGTAIRNKGEIRANTMVRGENGEILLKAKKDVTLEKESVITASGPSAGKITIEAEAGSAQVAGKVEAIAGLVGEKGGTIHLLGEQLTLSGSTAIDASGPSGGGTVLIGGDFQGQGPLQTARTLTVDAGASIRADALHGGDGGRVILWSDEVTAFSGAISARGGPEAGNGGFVEVSGKQFLRFRGTVDTGAPKGQIGTLLLDPETIRVVNNASPDDNQLNANNPNGGDPAGTVRFADGGSSTYTISDEAIEAQTANIVLQATKDIKIESGLSGGGLVLTTPGQSITLQAGRDIEIKSPVITKGGNIILEADSLHAATPNGDGKIKIDSPLSTLGSGATGGAITLIAGSNQVGDGGFEIKANINAGTGGINIGLSQVSPLPFVLGSGGERDLSNSEIARLATTGALTIGRATTGGSDGLGTGAQTLTVDSITHNSTTPISLSSASGSSFHLVAGSGGILLGKALTTQQNTFIETTGPLAINQTLATSNNNLTINAGSLSLGGSGGVSIGNAALSCTGTGCGAILPDDVTWDGGAGDSNWFSATNWSNDIVPGATQDVTIGDGFGTVTINGAAAARTLVAGSPVQLASGSLSVTNASTFSDMLTIVSGSLLGTGDVVIAGGGALAWTGGVMNGSGTFVLADGHSGTLNGALTLSRAFQSAGTVNLAGGTLTANASFSTHTLNLSGGSMTGSGSLTVTDSHTQTAGSINLGGSVSITQATGNLGLGPITASGITATAATGNLGLNGALSSTGDITLVTAGSFTNNAGALPLSAGGRWLVWSQDPANDTTAGLGHQFKQYNAVHGSSTVLGSGNGLLYSLAPVVTVDLTGTVTKVYDGTTGATLAPSHYTASGVVGGDTVTLNNPAAGSYDTSHAGTGKTVTVSGLSITGASEGVVPVHGYQLAGTTASGTVGTIDKADLTVSIGNVTKTYDATTAAPGATLVVTSGTLYANASNGNAVDSLAGGTFAYTNPNAGTGNKTVTVSGVTVNDGNGGGNYNLVLASNTTSTIDKAALALNAVSEVKVYDGTTASSATPSVAGLAGGDSVSGVSQSFASRNALGAGGSTLNVNGGFVVNDGNGGNNYNVAVNSTSGTINKAGLTLNAAGDTRIYDGTTSSAAAPTSSGLVGGDTVSGLSQTFASRNALGAGGSTLNVNGGYVVSDGNGGNNYTVTANAASGTINKATLTLSAVSDAKVYDGTTASAATPGATGLVGGDTVSGVSQSFASKNVLGAGGSTLTVNGYVVSDGNGGNNYTVAVNAATGTITPKALSAAGIAASSKVYDGNTTALVDTAGASLTGVVAGDSVSLNAGGSTAAFADRHVGVGKPVTVTGLALSGADAANYSIVPGAAPLSADITQLPSVAWTGGASGNWSVAGNWAGGALPDGSNVAQVVIPAGANVNYDLAGTTTLNTLSSGGGLQVSAGALGILSGATVGMPVAISGGSVDFGGATALQGGLVLSSGALAGSGAVTLSGASSWTGGTISGSGVLAIAPGASFAASSAGTLATARPITNEGRIDINAGTLQLDSFPVNAGAIHVVSGATLATNGNDLTNLGTVSGGGSIDLGAGRRFINAGAVRPGASPGTLTVNGDYVQASGGTLTVELAGTIPGAQHDALRVTGNAMLDGGLSIALTGGFVPDQAHVFDVVEAASVSGTFAAVTPPPSVSFGATYLASKVNIIAGTSVAAPAVPAAVPQAVQQQAGEIAQATENIQAGAGTPQQVAPVTAAEETTEKTEEKAGQKDAAPGTTKVASTSKKSKPTLCQ